MELEGVKVVVHLGPEGVFLAESVADFGKIAKKIAAVSAKVCVVGETGNNAHDKYSYATYTDVMVPLSKAMAEFGLAQIPMLQGFEQVAVGTGLKTIAHYTFTLIDGETGAMIVMPWDSEAKDFGMADKGLNKCATIAQKQWIKRLFLISTKEELENDTDNGKDSEPAKKATAKKTAPVAAKKQEAPKADDGPVWSADFRKWLGPFCKNKNIDSKESWAWITKAGLFDASEYQTLSEAQAAAIAAIGKYEDGKDG